MSPDAVQVSVIIPAYNCAHFLPEAVDSIRRQNHPALEIVIVNDGSTDATAEVAASFGDRVRCVHQANGGCAAARNAGLEAARGEFVSFLDADDLWPEDTLARQLPVLTGSLQAGIVLGKTQALSLVESAGGEPAHFEPFAYPWHMTILGSALCRRRVFETVGRFDVAIENGSDDVDWFFRAWECGVETILIDPVTLLYRMHSTNLTADGGSKTRNLLRALKRSLGRRRERNDGFPMPLSPRASIPTDTSPITPVARRAP